MVVLALLNLAEVLIYAGHSTGLSLNLLLKSYFVCCVMGLIFGYLYVADGVRYPIQKYLGVSIAIFGAIQIIAILGLDAVVGRYSLNSMPVVAQKGELFWIFQIFVLSSVFFACLVMFYNYAHAKDPKQQVAYAYTIAGVALLVLSIITIVVFMMLGIDANSTGIVPIATTFFLLITAKGKNTHLITKDPRRLNPLSMEAATATQIDRVQTQSALNNVSLKESVANIEVALIRYKLEKNQGNISETARQLGVARSTINKKLQQVTEG